MKREYYKNIFFISKENKIKINKAIDSLPEPMSMEEVQKVVGGRIIE